MGAAEEWLSQELRRARALLEGGEPARAARVLREAERVAVAQGADAARPEIAALAREVAAAAGGSDRHQAQGIVARQEGRDTRHAVSEARSTTESRGPQQPMTPEQRRTPGRLAAVFAVVALCTFVALWIVIFVVAVATQPSHVVWGDSCASPGVECGRWNEALDGFVENGPIVEVFAAAALGLAALVTYRLRIVRGSGTRARRASRQRAAALLCGVLGGAWCIAAGLASAGGGSTFLVPVHSWAPLIAGVTAVVAAAVVVVRPRAGGLLLLGCAAVVAVLVPVVAFALLVAGGALAVWDARDAVQPAAHVPTV